MQAEAKNRTKLPQCANDHRARYSPGLRPQRRKHRSRRSGLLAVRFSGSKLMRCAITMLPRFSVRCSTIPVWGIIMQSALMISAILLPEFSAAAKKSVISGRVRPFGISLKSTVDSNGRSASISSEVFKLTIWKSSLSPRFYACCLPYRAEI